MDLPILLQENMWNDPGNILITHGHIAVEIGTEAAQFSENICAFPRILGSPSSYTVWLCNRSHLNFLIYEENFIFFFISEIGLNYNNFLNFLSLEQDAGARQTALHPVPAPQRAGIEHWVPARVCHTAGPLTADPRDGQPHGRRISPQDALQKLQRQIQVSIYTVKKD